MSQERINRIRDIWQYILDRMRERRITPERLSSLTGYPVDRIRRGIKGEPVEITDDFLRECVMAFGLTSGRTRSYEETVDTLSFDECVNMLKPPPAMPPRQGNFWDW
ncbi:MAG: hypothetical protein HY670_04800 [Chloroflexi bacterium]|nr:hypothetical protein [Chloroflexota bacterium]